MHFVRAGLSVIFLVVLLPNAEAQAARKVKIEPNLAAMNWGEPKSIATGNVFIDQVVVTNTKSADDELPAEIEFDNQIGWGKPGATEYAILLKNTEVEDFARDIAELALEQSGYTVVSDPANAISVNVDVSELWVDANSIPGGKKTRFEFSVAMQFETDDALLMQVGSVQASGSRDGVRRGSGGSYLNAISSGVKEYLQQFSARLQDAQSALQKDSVNDGGAEVFSLGEQLEELQRLRNAGLLAEDEYLSLREKLLEEYL